MPRRKTKIKYSRKHACKYLTPKGDISNSLQTLCYCPERDLVLGTKAYVCQVCDLYSQTNKKISEVYQESKKEAEKKIKEREMELEEFKISDVKDEEEIDLSFDEFEEEEEFTTRFEKRKADKGDLESEEFAEVECPFCGELFDDLRSHIPNCEFAPEDVEPEDYIADSSKKESSADTINCPYCGKEYKRLSRHLPHCDNRPENADEEKEQLYMDGKIDKDELLSS
ncbi:MAG: hypothetical protein P8Y70_19685 [Candidatus Lokiarchaeota archaeon]